MATTTTDKLGMALPLTHNIYDALPRGDDGERLKEVILEYGGLCAANALKSAQQSVPTASAPDIGALTKTTAKLRQAHSEATADISDKDPEEFMAKNSDLEGKPVPFTMYEVEYEGDDGVPTSVKPVTITRFGINEEVGATAPSVSVTYANRRKALASANMFYMREEWAQAELDQGQAQAKREAAKEEFTRLACKMMPDLLDVAEAFVDRSATNLELTNQVQAQAAEIARLRTVVEEVHSWIVCAAIASPEDMAQNFQHIETITSPDFKGYSQSPVFEVTAFGFDGATDETDDRVLWVSAPSIEVVQAVVAGMGTKVCELLSKPTLDDMVDVDFHLPQDTVALQEKCLHFMECDDEERLRRTQDLPNLQNSAGAAYTFFRMANMAAANASKLGTKVDWQKVESNTIEASVFQNGQKPADVAAVLLRHSPGAVGVGRRGGIAERFLAAEERLRKVAPERGPSEPTI